MMHYYFAAARHKSFKFSYKDNNERKKCIFHVLCKESGDLANANIPLSFLGFFFYFTKHVEKK